MTIEELGFTEGTFCEHCRNLAKGSLVAEDMWCIDCWYFGGVSEEDPTDAQLKFLRLEQETRQLAYAEMDVSDRKKRLSKLKATS